METYNFPDGKNDDRWYHWCIENWGTKWNYQNSTEYDEEVLELTFSTAWSPPEGVMEKLKDKYPDLGLLVSMMPNQWWRLQDTIRTV